MYLINLFVALSSSIHANLKVDVEDYSVRSSSLFSISQKSFILEHSKFEPLPLIFGFASLKPP